MEKHRKPAVAGMFYPGKEKKLTHDIKGYLAASEKMSPQPVKFLISPHAGYMYSGGIAGDAFAEIRGADYDRVYLLGPSHRHSFQGIAESEESYWDLPNGSASIEAIDHPGIIMNSRYHEHEHCLEVQLPFLIHLLPNARYIPLLLSGAYHNAIQYAEQLQHLDDDRTLWIISSDFNHVGPNFQHYPQQFGFASGESMDMQAIDLITKGDCKGLVAFLEKTEATICGALPILTAMHLIQKLNRANFVFKRYDSSGSQTGDSNSVGYASLFSC